MRFDPTLRRFELRFRHDPQVNAPALIYVPHFHYPDGYRVELSDGRVARDEPAQILIYHHTAGAAEHQVIVEPWAK